MGSTKKKIKQGKSQLEHVRKNLKRSYFQQIYLSRLLSQFEKVRDCRMQLIQIERYLEEDCIYEAALLFKKFQKKLDEYFPKSAKPALSETVLVKHLKAQFRGKLERFCTVILRFMTDYIYMIPDPTVEYSHARKGQLSKGQFS